MSSTSPSSDLGDVLSQEVGHAVERVPDPEYPDISIVDLGLVESIDVRVDRSGETTAVVGLIPTYSGCPALKMIAADVVEQVEKLPTIDVCQVAWLSAPAWSTDRLSLAGRRKLAGDYTVVLRNKQGGLRCPLCGSSRVEDRSEAGPTRCRSVAWCTDCRNPVEVLR